MNRDLTPPAYRSAVTSNGQQPSAGNNLGSASEDQQRSMATRERNDTPHRPACPVCGGPLIEIRAKLQCAQCHTICETCCEGGRG